MVEQLLIAYAIGMIAAIGMEIGKIVKARRLNRAAALKSSVAPAAPAYSSVRAMSRDAAAAVMPANEPAPLMKAAG